jgi:hypothetical protein
MTRFRVRRVARHLAIVKLAHLLKTAPRRSGRQVSTDHARILLVKDWREPFERAAVVGGMRTCLASGGGVRADAD